MERKGRHRLFSNPLFQAGSPTHSSVASMSAANAEEGSIQEDRGSSSSNDSGRNSARALHPVVSAAMSRIDSRATDLSSEESFDAVAPMLPLPPNSALSASSNQEARAPTHATTTASTHRSSAHAPRLSQPPPNNNTLHIGYCGVSEATHAVGAGLSGEQMRHAMFFEQTKDVSCAAAVSMRESVLELRLLLHTCVSPCWHSWF